MNNLASLKARSAPSKASDTPSTPPSMDDFYVRIAKSHLAPLWESLKGLVPSEPKPRAVPWMWSFSEVRGFLTEAGGLISAEEAERRTLILKNPGLDGQLQVTDTLYAGMQLILPGEIAPPHRHSQSALRFVLDGVGATTTVDGERTVMHPGDLIITPAMTWHEHGGGSEPMIWMDGLDVPLLGFLRAGFREEHSDTLTIEPKPNGISDARYGASMLPLRDSGKRHTSPIFNYPYVRSRDALERMRSGEIDPVHGYALRYINPTTGDWAIPTLATSLRLLPGGWTSQPYRSVDGVVMVVTEGQVEVQIGSTKLMAGPKDTFCIPGWLTHTLRATEDTVLFAFSDRPVYEKLGLWRHS